MRAALSGSRCPSRCRNSSTIPAQRISRCPVPGARVRVPFGRQQLIGICVSLDPPDPHPQPRPLTAVVDRESLFGGDLYGLALWMADYYHHPLGEVLGTLMPAEIRRGADLATSYRPPRIACWALTDPRPAPGRAPRQLALVRFLERNARRGHCRESSSGGLQHRGDPRRCRKGDRGAPRTGDSRPPQ